MRVLMGWLGGVAKGRDEGEAACPWEPGGSSRGAKSLRPDLRTGNSEGRRTSY